MQLNRIAVERVLDAREQFVAMCVALCPPPTIQSRAPARITNDVARLIGECWVLTPVRRFLATVAGGHCRPIVVSIGPTLGIVSADEDDVWTRFHSLLCWLGCYCDRVLAWFDDSSGWPRSMQLVDVTRTLDPVPLRIKTMPSPRHEPLKYWGNHKWVLGFREGELLLNRADSTSSWVGIAIPSVVAIDVVFSHTAPGLIGPGDEASVLVSTDTNDETVVRRLMTVDLGKSFSSGSLAAVSEGEELSSQWGSRCHTCLFIDGSCHLKTVELHLEPDHAPFSAFDVSFETGERTKLRGGCQFVDRVSNEIVMLGTTPYHVFTRQACASVPRGWQQNLMNRGFVVGPEEPSPITPIKSRAVIDMQTGVTLCRFRSASFIVFL
ncbi:hypothetical protein Pelo_15142 [Pelomyxa schiedti]|nr:hypothetical protein Pelo_15142 [Pelomyxa schiedti]